jgi:site-specific DNA-methyltransferase (adenine-specific)
MGRKWDNTGNFYEWNKERATELFRVIKHGGYVAIFGHPKTNHRMKCAFEDAGFKIVEEIDWVYLTGMPKNQDISKLFDKAAGAERKVIGVGAKQSPMGKNHGILNEDKRTLEEANQITAPSTDLAKQWNGWKTSGLKPAHEPITIFQKPLEGTYINNIEKYGCGGMNIDACRVPISKADIDMLNAKASKNPTTNYSDRDDKVYGAYAEDKAMPPNELGRFPANIVLDEYTAQILDKQTGISKSSGGSGDKSKGALGKSIYGTYSNEELAEHAGGLGDVGGGSKLFTVIKYNQKVSPKERLLPNGERNPHVTLKPVELIKWLIKLLTPIDGKTIDICAGSCTHAVACEELNKNDGYNLKWLNIELMNTENEPYCNTGKVRIEQYVS